MFFPGRVNVFPRPCNSGFPAINSLFGTEKLPAWYGVSPCSPGSIRKFGFKYRESSGNVRRNLVFQQIIPKFAA